MNNIYFSFSSKLASNLNEKALFSLKRENFLETEHPKWKTLKTDIYKVLISIFKSEEEVLKKFSENHEFFISDVCSIILEHIWYIVKNYHFESCELISYYKKFKIQTPEAKVNLLK
jgi:hypothetical protein